MSDAKVQDRTDPSGMFSKAGRTAAEMYNILLNGPDILENKRKFHKVNSVSLKVYDDPTIDIVSKRIQNELLKNIPNLLDDEKPKSDSQYTKDNFQKRKKIQLQPFTLTTSREKREIAFGIKKVSSSGAIYKPKYSVVEKKEVQNIDFNKIIPRDNGLRSNGEKVIDTQSTLHEPHLSIDKLSPKVKGVVELDKQLYRVDPITLAFKNKSIVEERFTPVEWPKNYSGSVKTMSVDLQKMPSRKEIFPIPETINCSTYEPNYDYSKKRINQYDRLMGINSGRKFDSPKPYYTNEQTYDFDEYVKKNKSKVFPHVKSPKFDMMAPRDKDPESKLPSYLQSFSRISNTSIIQTPHRGGSNFDLKSYISGSSLENSLFIGTRSVKS